MKYNQPKSSCYINDLQTLSCAWVMTSIAFFLDLREELRPDKLPDVSEVASFDASKLKHVETKESNVLPSKEGNFFFFGCSEDAHYLRCVVYTL